MSSSRNATDGQVAPDRKEASKEGPASGKILIVDDDREMGELVKDALSALGCAVTAASDPFEALRQIECEEVDLLVTDLRMDRMNGLDLLEKAKGVRPDIAVIVMTAFGTIGTAIEAIKRGAYHYIPKPFKMEELTVLASKALESKKVLDENRWLRRAVTREFHFGNLIGASKPMQEIFELIRRVSFTMSHVLITGESGTGKELVAKAIHFNGPRARRPFIPINCTAIPEGLLESELFGHVRGAFTGATMTKRGLFEKAHGGTLFFDEIGDMGISLQGKMLRALQDKEIRPVGGTSSTQVDARIISATNKNIKAAVAANEFREDLYYRLNVIPIHLPSLRERPEDVPLLAMRFFEQYGEAAGGRVKSISKEAMACLKRLPWRGNVRELENVIERAVALAEGDTIRPEDLPLDEDLRHIELIESALARHLRLDDLEREYITRVLEEAGGNKQKAAKVLGINRRTLYRKERAYEVARSAASGEEDDATSS